MLALIFDTETTGLIKHPSARDEVQPRIIEWAGVLADRNVVYESFATLVYPGQPITEEIQRITGITNDELVMAPSFAEVSDQIKSIFAAADALVAHNLPFDKGMMELELRRHGMMEGWPWPPVNICTVQEHAEEWGYRPKLSQLYLHYMSEPYHQTHRALDDVRALLEIVRKGQII